MATLLTRLRFLAVAIFVLLPLGCASSQILSQESHISGTAAYRERMALPPQSELHLVLYGIASDGSREKLKVHDLVIQGQVPVAFRLSGIHPQAEAYELEASILADGEVLFATAAPLAVHSGDTNVHLMLHRVLSEQPVSSSLPSPSLPDLMEKQWVLSRLHGEPVQKFPDQPEPHLIFTPESAGMLRLSGSDGCNRLIGTCQITEDSVQFSQMGSTMMLCPAGEEQARAFAGALASTTNWRFANAQKDQLELLNGDEPLLVLEAQPIQ